MYIYYLFFTSFLEISKISILQFQKSLSENKLEQYQFLCPFYWFFNIDKTLIKEFKNYDDLKEQIEYQIKHLNKKQIESEDELSNEETQQYLSIKSEKMIEQIISIKTLFKTLLSQQSLKEIIIAELNINNFDLIIEMLKYHIEQIQNTEYKLLRLFGEYIIYQIVASLIYCISNTSDKEIYAKGVLSIQTYYQQYLLFIANYETINESIEETILLFKDFQYLSNKKQQQQFYEFICDKFLLSGISSVRKFTVELILSQFKSDQLTLSEILIKFKDQFNILLSDQNCINKILTALKQCQQIDYTINNYSNFQLLFISNNQQIYKLYKKQINIKILSLLTQHLLKNDRIKAQIFQYIQYIESQVQIEYELQELQDFINRKLTEYEMITSIVLLNQLIEPIEIKNIFIQQLINEYKHLVIYVENEQLSTILVNVDQQLIPYKYPSEQEMKEFIQQCDNNNNDLQEIYQIELYLIFLLKMKQNINTVQIANYLQLINKQTFLIESKSLISLFTYITILQQSFPNTIKFIQSTYNSTLYDLCKQLNQYLDSCTDDEYTNIATNITIQLTKLTIQQQFYITVIYFDFLNKEFIQNFITTIQSMNNTDTNKLIDQLVEQIDDSKSYKSVWNILQNVCNKLISTKEEKKIYGSVAFHCYRIVKLQGFQGQFLKKIQNNVLDDILNKITGEENS